MVTKLIGYIKSFRLGFKPLGLSDKFFDCFGDKGHDKGGGSHQCNQGPLSECKWHGFEDLLHEGEIYDGEL